MSTGGRRPRRVGAWRAAVGARRVLVPVVVIDAAVQALSVVSDPTPTPTAGFAARTAASTAAAMVALWLVACAVSASADGVPRQALDRARRHPGALGWAAATVLLGAAAWSVSAWPGVLVLVIGPAVLAAATAGAGPAAAGRAVAAAPRHAAAVVGISLVALVAAWAVALGLGLFVTGTPAAALTWVWFGLTAAVLLGLWCSWLGPRGLAHPGGCRSGIEPETPAS